MSHYSLVLRNVPQPAVAHVAYWQFSTHEFSSSHETAFYFSGQQSTVQRSDVHLHQCGVQRRLLQLIACSTRDSTARQIYAPCREPVTTRSQPLKPNHIYCCLQGLIACTVKKKKSNSVWKLKAIKKKDRITSAVCICIKFALVCLQMCHHFLCAASALFV